MSDEPIVDTSNVTEYLRSRRRVAVMNSMWRPVLAGAVASLAVSAAVWIVLPKFSVREVVVDRVVQRDVTADHVIPRDVEINNPVPHEVPIEIPQIVLTRSPQESAFANSRDFADAPMRGRIVPSRGERSLSFDDDHDYVPTNPRMAADAAPFVGDLGFCSKIPGDEEHFHCVALHGGKIVPVRQRPVGRPT